MKPIIISTEDVRAILDGRKTMARRVVKPRHGGDLEVHSDIAGTPRLSERCGDRCRGLIPPYEVGDALYVRETWTMLIDSKGDLECFYRADMENSTGHYKKTWRSPISMPREAARLFLLVKDVRVEKNEESGQWTWVIEFERIERGAES